VSEFFFKQSIYEYLNNEGWESTSENGIALDKEVIVYSNPFLLPQIITLTILLWDKIKVLKSILIQMSVYKNYRSKLYFISKNIFWWKRFRTYGELKILSEQIFSASFEKKFIPNNNLGKMLYNFLYRLESFSFPKYS
jgi:hypothetical protein